MLRRLTGAVYVGNVREWSISSLPSGELTFCYGKIHHFSWKNPLCLWPFSIAMLVHQRVDLVIQKPFPNHIPNHQKMAIEIVDFPIKMVGLSIVFCMFTRGYHTISHEYPMNIPWISHEYPIKPPFSYGFPMVVHPSNPQQPIQQPSKPSPGPSRTQPADPSHYTADQSWSLSRKPPQKRGEISGLLGGSSHGS